MADEKQTGSARPVVKHFEVTKRTTYRGRLVFPERGAKPAFTARVTTDAEGKCIFDGNSCWRECEAPKEIKKKK